MTEFILPNPWQPREGEDAEHIKKIALSIASEGLLQVPVGRLVDANGQPVSIDEVSKYVGPAATVSDFWAEAFVTLGCRVQLAFGHSRLAAFRWLETVKDHTNLSGRWDAMPVRIQDLSDERMFQMGIGENLARKDLSPIEEARAMLRYRDDFGKTSAEIGALFNLAESSVRNKMRLLGLPADLLAALAEGRLSEGAGRALLALFELPAAMEARMENMSAYAGNRKSIVDIALRGGAAEVVNDQISLLIKQLGRDLSDAKWTFDERVDASRDERIRCELCRECDHLLRREKHNICGDPACYGARRELWIKDRLAAAGEVCGVQPAEDVNKSYYEYTDLDKAVYEVAMRAGCENLRLVYNPNPAWSERERTVPGFPDVSIRCGKRQQYCTCASGYEAMRKAEEARILREKGTQGVDSQTRQETREAVLEDVPTADDLRDAARARRKQEKQDKAEIEAITEDFAKRLAGAFLDRNQVVMMKLFGHAFYGIDRGQMEKADPFEIVLIAAREAVKENYYGTLPSPQAVLARANEFLKKAGLAVMESEL
jgi:ParB/RepB/Spo0J family partition protein